MFKKFTHLHLHSVGSLLDGMIGPEDLAKKCKELNMDAVAVTEHGNFFSAVKFYSEMRKHDIKPIMGIEAYIAPSMEIKNKEQPMNHLVLLAKDLTGYRNLLKLSSESYIRGFYNKPRIDFETLCKYKEGVIVLSACLAGELPRALTEYRVVQPRIVERYTDQKTGEKMVEVVQEEIRELLPLDERFSNAINIAKKYKEVFGEDYYIEVMRHGLQDEELVYPLLIQIADELNIKIVATNDCHYLNKEDAKAHETLLAIQGISGMEGFESCHEFYVKSYDEMAELFPEEYLKTSVEIADKCNVRIEELEQYDLEGNKKPQIYYFPEYNPPNGKTVEEFMYDLCVQGFHDKLAIDKIPLEKQQEYWERFEYEFKVIKDMGFCGYFVILWDVYNFCRENKIPYGPGRGSAAGSLIAYLMGLVEVDPIKYDLLFERFLNPDRVSMPDLDCDFDYDRIGEILDYVKNKYGQENFALIGTFGKLATKAVLKDVGRALGYDFDKMNQFTKNMPDTLEGDDEDDVVKLTVENAIERLPEFRKEVENDSLLAQVVSIAKELQGLNRHPSKHAAGVIITPKDKPLANYIALRSDPDGSNITIQGDMGDAERLGFVKMDFLRLRTLTVVDNCVKLIKQNKGIDIDIYNDIPLDDEKTLDLFKKGNTVSIFQFESEGMQQLLQSALPNKFEDLIVLNALYRPGPLDYIDESTGYTMVETYVKRKNGELPVEYDHPILEPILKDTFGVIAFQEQLMRIAVDMASYTMSDADNLRKIVGKKLADKMPEERGKFIGGAIANNVDEQIATRVWEQIETFASYGFNKSHSTAYAFLAYITGYLKTHYPVEYMCATLTSVMDNQEKFVKYLKEAKRMGIKILPPHIIKSDGVCTVEGDSIRYGLGAIKGVGRTAVEEILKVKNENSFNSFLGFYLSVDTRVVNKTVITSLIYSGAFDYLGHTRSSLLVALKDILQVVKKIKSRINSNAKRKNPVQDISVFWQPLYEITVPEIEELPLSELLDKELELTGVYLSESPLDMCRDIINKHLSHTSSELKLVDKNNCTVFMGGMIVSFKEIVVKRGRTKGQIMAKLSIQDFEGEFSATAFPDIYSRHKSDLAVGNIVLIRGKTSEYNGDIQVTLTEVNSININNVNRKEKHIEEEPKNILNVLASKYKTTDSKIRNLFKLFRKHRGDSNLNLIIIGDESEEVIDVPLKVEITDNLIKEIESFDNILNVWEERE